MRVSLFSIAFAIAPAMAAYLDLIGVKRAFENAHVH
jgi:hypothetical protein